MADHAQVPPQAASSIG